jgi:hypothetical protein
LLEPKPEKYFVSSKQPKLELPLSATTTTSATATTANVTQQRQVTLRKNVGLTKKPRLVIKE